MNTYVTPAEAAKLAKEWFDLPVPINADVLKVAYRKVAMLLHPDRGGDTAKFQSMQEAYRKLCSCHAVFQGDVNEADMLVEQDVTTKTYVCWHCAGVGKVKRTKIGPIIQCPKCNGKGRLAKAVTTR